MLKRQGNLPLRSLCRPGRTGRAKLGASPNEGTPRRLPEGVAQIEDMGEVNVAIKVQNWLDIEKIALGERFEPPRTVETLH